MKRILLYSPDVIGHPRVYCRVISDALMGEPCELVIAMGFTEAAGLEDSPDLYPLVTRERVSLIDTRAYSNTGEPNLTAEELAGLQAALNIDTTLFIEADKSNHQFRRIAAGEAPRLRGRNLGIFANTAEWYPGEDSFTGERRTIFAPTLRTTLGNIKRAVFNRRNRARYFYERIIIGRRVLDEVLVKDERLAEWRGPPVYWMPEISRPLPAAETTDEHAEHERRAKELGAFLASNQDREPVLYFGDAAYYKGYDLFLRFISKNSQTCAIHAGRSYDEQQLGYFTCDVKALRAQLRAEGRLYETSQYVHSQRLKELFFRAIRVYITTHRLALSSSSVIQAAEFGIPVLVPNRGLLAYRVQTNQLGWVYQYQELDDLSIRAKGLWAADLGQYRDHLAKFWDRFSDESIRTFFAARLVNPNLRP